MVSADVAAKVTSNGSNRLRCNILTAEQPNFKNIFAYFCILTILTFLTVVAAYLIIYGSIS